MTQLFDEVRQAIEKSEKSRYRIARESGVSESQLSQFMSGKLGLGVGAMERVVASLGLRLALIPFDEDKMSAPKKTVPKRR